MTMQKKLLVVANLLNTSHLEKIQQYCTYDLGDSVDMHLAYIVPVIPAYYLQIPSTQSLQDLEEENAKYKLNEYGSILSVPDDNKWLLFGSINWAAHVLAEKLSIDNVVLEDDNHEIEKTLASLGTCAKDTIKEKLNGNEADLNKEYFYDFSYVI